MIYQQSRAISQLMSSRIKGISLIDSFSFQKFVILMLFCLKIDFLFGNSIFLQFYDNLMSF